MSKLTDATAKAAKPGSEAREITDGTVPGLAMRILPSGAKTWALRARLSGQRIRIDLGTYPATTLKDARRKAHDALRVIERGDDPRYEGVTVAEAVTEYLQSKSGHCRERTLANERRRFELHVLPIIGTYGIRTVKPAKLSALLRGIATGPDAKPVEANRVYWSLRGLFRWCRRNMGSPEDPTELIDKPTKEEPSAVRRREGAEPLLDTAELAKLWNAAPTLGGSVLPDLLRCLLLVPLRREEWTGLRWTERRDNFIADGWTGPALALPADRMKGRRPATVPLPATAAEILDARRKLTSTGKYVFAVPGREEAFAGWRRGADALRAALGAGLPATAVRDDWSPHTIRASVATAMVRDLGADELLVGRILQHSPRSALGITDTYQRSARLAEQAELLERWSQHLQAAALAMQAPTAAGNVVSLKPSTAA